MALYDLGTAILALSALFGIFSFLQASDTTLIPLDQLTVEEAYLEVQLIKRQLSSANPPNMTAEQKAILDKMFNTDLGALKPNDPLPYVCRQQLSKFRQAFTNWDQPLKPGTIEYMLTRALGQGYLYQAMINYVYRSVTRGHKDYPEAVSRGFEAVDELCNVYNEVKKKNDNSSLLVKPEDVKKLEVAIEKARDAVMALPKLNEYGELVPGTSSSSKQSTSSGILSEESQDKPDVGASLPAAEEVEDTPLIPLDKLTVEQAYLEHYLIDLQLRSAKPPSMTAEQKAIFDRLYNINYVSFKPNDPLPNTLRQLMTEFRQAFKNWNQPLKRGTAEYQITRADVLSQQYNIMVRNVYNLVIKAHPEHQGYQEVFSRGMKAVVALSNVYKEVKKKYDNSFLKQHDLDRLEAAIKVARDAVMAMPRVDENGEPVLGTSSSKQSTSSGILPEESQGKPDVGASLPAAGQVEDSTAGDGGDPVGPDKQLPSGCAGSMPGGWSSSPPRKSRNKLFPLLKNPYVWGSALVLAAGAGYYFLNSHPSASASGDLYSLSTSTLNLATIASEGSSLFWYIILPLGGLVALVVLGYWFCCFKVRGTSPEDEAKAATEVSKRASKMKSKQLPPTTTGGSPSSAGTAST